MEFSSFSRNFPVRILLNPLITVGALSLHAIFEGLVFGLAEKVEEVFGTIAAVIIHKSIIAFSTGMQLLTSGLPEWIT